jgi:hypothetical protein
MSNQSFWYLENVDVTGIFCPKKIGRGDMEKHVHRTYKRGEYIYLPEEHADRIFFLTEGRVKIGTYGETGKEITKAILSKGEVFGELSLVGEEKRRDFCLCHGGNPTLCGHRRRNEIPHARTQRPEPVSDEDHGLPHAGHGKPPGITRFQGLPDPHHRIFA